MSDCATQIGTLPAFWRLLPARANARNFPNSTHILHVYRNKFAMNSQTSAIDGDLLWRASASQIEASGLAAFQRWLLAQRGLRFGSYTELWQWPVDELEVF